MRTASILHALGWICTILAATMLLPAAIAITADSLLVAQAFLVPFVVVGFVGGGLILAFQGRGAIPTRHDSVLLLAVLWLSVPIAAALPLYTAGYPKAFIDALFESVSGFTTTGATVFTDLSGVPRSVLAWRAMLQWLGGLASLLAIAALLGPLASINQPERHFGVLRSGAASGTPFLVNVARRVTPLYLALTIACFIALVLSEVPEFDAFCLALATLSTGGFMPRSGPVALYGSPAAEVVLGVFMLLGAVSVVWIGAIFERRWAVVRELREPVWILSLTIAFAGALIALALVRLPDMGIAMAPHGAASAFASAASLISTTGFPIAADIQTITPYMALLVVCFIGGGRFSTAGGLKVYRVVAMLHQLGRELMLLLYPHEIRSSRTGEERQDARLMKLVWTTFVAFITTLAGLTLILSWTGVPFIASLLAGVGALSNVGPIYDFVHLEEFPNAPHYVGMSAPAKLALGIGMILGRMEIVAFLSLLTVAYWRH